MYSSPFEWAFIPDFFEQSLYKDLVKSFPATGFTLTEKDEPSAEKAYRSYHLTAVADGEPQPQVFSTLSQAWRMVLDYLGGNVAMQQLEHLSGRSLRNTRLEARFVLYDTGCWIAPHRDRKDKVLTQTFYFPVPQTHCVGGDLLILKSEDIGSVVERVPPTANSSVILLPSSRSWHAVSKVCTTRDAPRRCLLTHYRSMDESDD